MDVALVAANAALVIVTLAYVILTGRMVGELRKTRLLSILPRIALDVHNLGAGLGLITVTNIGRGPAVDVQATLTFEGLGEARAIAFHTVSEGEGHQFLPPLDSGNELMRMDALSAVVGRVTLRGVMHDGLRNAHSIDEEIDLAEVWEITKISQRRLPPDHLKEAVDHLKATKDALQKLHNVAERAYYSAWPPSLNDESR